MTVVTTAHPPPVLILSQTNPVQRPRPPVPLLPVPLLPEINSRKIRQNVAMLTTQPQLVFFFSLV